MREKRVRIGMNGKPQKRSYRKEGGGVVSCGSGMREEQDRTVRGENEGERKVQAERCRTVFFLQLCNAV